MMKRTALLAAPPWTKMTALWNKSCYQCFSRSSRTAIMASVNGIANDRFETMYAVDSRIIFMLVLLWNCESDRSLRCANRHVITGKVMINTMQIRFTDDVMISWYRFSERLLYDPMNLIEVRTIVTMVITIKIWHCFLLFITVRYLNCKWIWCIYVMWLCAGNLRCFPNALRKILKSG